MAMEAINMGGNRKLSLVLKILAKMKEILYGIGFLLLIVMPYSLAKPTDLENLNVIVSEPLLEIKNNKEVAKPKEIIQQETQSLEVPSDLTATNGIVELMLPENVKETTRNIEIADNNNSKKSLETLADLKAENKKKEEDFKFKDSPKDVEQKEIDKQTVVWKDFDNDFSLLEERLPDLTAEEYHEINKEGAMPWNFLKSLDTRREIIGVKPKPMQAVAPIYITVPIVINTHSNLPITLSIGGQNVPLNTAVPVKETPKQMQAAVKESAGSSTLATPTSIYNKLMDYNESPAAQTRPTNRHRSNFRKKIYARHNGHDVEAYEY